MIRSGKEYRPYKASIVGDGKYTVFSLSDSEKDKTTGQWVTKGWISVFVTGNYPIGKNDYNNPFKFKLETINGVELREWQGKTYTTVYGDITVTEWGTCPHGATEVATATPNDFMPMNEDDTDLPF